MFTLEFLCHIDAIDPIVGNLSGWAISMEQTGSRDMCDDAFAILLPVTSLFFSYN